MFFAETHMMNLAIIKLDRHSWTCSLLSSFFWVIFVAKKYGIIDRDYAIFLPLLKLSLIFRTVQHFGGLICAFNVLSCHFFAALSMHGACANQFLPEKHSKVDHCFFGLLGCLYSILLDQFIDDFEIGLHKNYYFL